MRLIFPLSSFGVSLLAPISLLACATSPSTDLSRLPAGLTLQEKGPQKYRFTCDYLHFDVQGNFKNKQRVQAEYTRNLPGGRLRWRNATVAFAGGFTDAFAGEQKQACMEDFGYSDSEREDMLKPKFFKDFPASPFAPLLKNLVWDTHMIEGFGQGYFERLKLNEPFRPEKGSGDVPLAGMGKFHNTQIELTWIGNSERNGEACALIRYQAFFNRFEINFMGTPSKGRSHYWGEIWVSLEDKQIEHATLYEDVLLGPPDLEQAIGKLWSVFRIGTLEKVPPSR